MSQISSTLDIPATSMVPAHVAIIMDGNGRWATSRYLPRVTGHVKGVEAVRGIVRACIERGIAILVEKPIALELADAQRIVSSMLKHFEFLQKSHATLARLTPKSLTEVQPLELHPGAAAAYRQAGLIK